MMQNTQKNDLFKRMNRQIFKGMIRRNQELKLTCLLKRLLKSNHRLPVQKLKSLKGLTYRKIILSTKIFEIKTDGFIKSFAIRNLMMIDKTLVNGFQKIGIEHILFVKRLCFLNALIVEKQRRKSIFSVPACPACFLIITCHISRNV